MTAQKGVWGIDIGQSALKALRLEDQNGKIVATAFDYIEHPKILSQPDSDAELMIREALQKFLSRNKVKGDLVAMSVPGQSGLARFVKLPPVEEKKINDIVHFEAKQQIPFNLNEVVWDYQKIGSGVVTDGFAMETEIGLFAIKRETVARYLQQMQDVEVEVHIIQMAPLSLCNFLSFDALHKRKTAADEDRKECLVGLDIGTDNSSLVITDGNRLIWQRQIPIGGNNFTQALVKDLKLTFARAEHLKRNATKSPELKKILLALKPVLTNFVNEVQRSLGFFTNTHRDVDIQYLLGMGNAFRLPGLQKFLSEKLQLEVHKLQKFHRLHGDSVVTAPSFQENLMSFGTAYGLALQGLNVTLLRTNLLPREIQVARIIRSKKPWALTAAACLLAGTAVLAFGYSRQYRAVGAPEIRREMTYVDKTVLPLVNQWKQKCEAKQIEIHDLDHAVRSVLAGQDERINWIKLNKFINDCLPQPDGSNLKDSQKELYWAKPGMEDRVKGQVAYEEFKQRLAGRQAGQEAQHLQDLIQFNIEAVDCLFTDNLEHVFAQSPYFVILNKRSPSVKEKADTIAMREQDYQKPPTGPGWIVQIRGFTDHKDTRQFIINTLLENLKNADKAPTGEANAQDKLPSVGSRVSHVFLYRTQSVDNPDPDKFSLIDKNFLPTLIPLREPRREETTPDAPAIPGVPGAAPAPAVPAVPFTASASDRKRFGWMSLLRPSTATKDDQPIFIDPSQPAKEDSSRPQQGLRRTEFVIMFVWREPTPSDELRKPRMGSQPQDDSTAEQAAAP
ncbi:MAG: type IV pilus assembly protein PilM [Gemmataceae bacterium]